MTQNTTSAEVPIAAWHRNLLAVAAVFTVLLIAMGGVLCVTQSIRSCPDWPGCPACPCAPGCPCCGVVFVGSIAESMGRIGGSWGNSWLNRWE